MKKAIEIEKRGTLNTQTGYVFETSTKSAPKSAPRTVASVLLERWANDTEEMRCALVHKDMSGGYWYMTKNKYGMFCWIWTLHHSDAMKYQEEFLNSAAEVGK